MPYLPKKQCAAPGCGAAAQKGSAWCGEHARQHARQRFVRDADALYKTGGWRALRGAQLRREPLCAECLRRGKVKPAAEVDHITPHKGDRTLFFDPKNLQSLCKKCHSAKTAREDGGFGNALRQ